MNNKPKTKLLTISLLCCGRPETTERCLKSLMPIRQAIDSEIQVVDTGCSKETRAIVEKYADEVFEFEWCNDFAKARNFQLDQANGKMFLYIDDDEYFLDCTYIIDFFKQPDCTSYNIGGYFQRNYLDMQGKEYQDIEVVRMCSVTPETCFKGKIHEYIEPAYGNAMFMDARAGHFGYVYASQEDNIKHSLRNIPLIKEMMVEDPDNFRWPYQLAQEYKAIGYNKELLEICKESFEKTGTDKETEVIRYRGSFACGLVIAMARLEMLDEILEFYEDVKKKDLILPLPLAKLAYYAAKVYFIRDENEKCEKEIDFYFKTYEAIGHYVGIIYIQGGLFASDTFDDTNLNLMYCYAMTCGLRRDDYGPLVHYYRRLTWDSPVVRINRGFLSTLLQKAAEVGYKKEIRDVLNKFFTTEGFRNVLEKAIDEMSASLNENALINLKEAFKTTEGEKELGLFMDVRILENEIANVDYWDNYRQIIDVLEAYAQLTIKWQTAHDTLYKSDEPAELAPETLVGCGINDFIKYADSNPTKSLTILKELFGKRSALTNILTELSRLYGQKQKVLAAKSSDPVKYEEMYNLEEQVLHQIAELDETGKTDEAVAVYQQLVEIIQNTFGVDTLHI